VSRAVLIVDDDRDMAEMLVTGLGRRGFRASACASAEQALATLAQGRVDVLVTDLRLGGMDGVELCTRVVAEYPALPVVVMTAFGAVEVAVAALRARATDFFSKPFDVDALADAIEHIVPLPAREAGRGLIGESAVMRRLDALIGRVARSEATLVVSGESGTGKELVARAIHARSRRSAGPFVALNCAALPEPLLESELFGHGQGAFTDAKRAHQGLLARGDGGTVFLDEVSELSLGAQAKLLRALEERSVRRVGEAEESPFDARLIAASNRNLEEAARSGRFRWDLLHRLQVIPIDLPPLRERGDDVIELALHFIATLATAGTTLDDEAAALLRGYAWPGNVRELRNCIEHAVVLGDGKVLRADDLPERLRARPTTSHSTDALEVIEQRHVLQVLRAVGGNRALAARVLGIGRKTLYRKLDAWGVERE
jgi:DNA-binding NtrC family response regulator